MTTLPVTGTAISPDEAWQKFLTKRQNITARMEMETCNDCDECGTRCMDGFGVTRDEFNAVQAYLKSQDPEEVARIAREQKTVSWPGAEDTGATMTYCRFRDRQNRRCSIYPVRPTICRLFGHTKWLPCPIGAVRSVPEDGAAFWNEYRTFERRPFSAWQEQAEREQTELEQDTSVRDAS